MDHTTKEHRNLSNVSIDMLTYQLEQMRLLALKTANPSAGVATVMAIAKRHGFLITKIEQNVTIGLADKLMTDTRNSATRWGIEMGLDTTLSLSIVI